MPEKSYSSPTFLVDLLSSRSPSGCEAEAQAVFDRYVEPVSDEYSRDTMGNRIAVLNPGGDPVLMLAGHMDELGLIVKYVNKEGFLYFDTVGGHDRTVIPGRRVVIQTRNGAVLGVTGKRAIHLMKKEEREKLPKIHEMWIDIGAKNREEAFERIAIGDTATYDQGFELLHGSVGVARAFDNKAGAYVVGEVLRRLAEGDRPDATVISVATTQEEIGTRGATTATYSVNPNFAIAVDVGHATDHPDCDPRQHGESCLGGGPIVCRGPNINPIVYERLIACAREGNIPIQLEADPRPTGTDARAIQVGRSGVATGLVSIPLRYMHTPSEVVDLEDVENVVRLLVAFARSLKRGESGVW